MSLVCVVFSGCDFDLLSRRRSHPYGDARCLCLAALQERLPGGYDGDGNSPLGSPTAAGTDRYAGAEGAAFGDVEEDEGASGNPGVADLQQSSKGDGQVWPCAHCGSATSLRIRICRCCGGAAGSSVKGRARWGREFPQSAVSSCCRNTWTCS